MISLLICDSNVDSICGNENDVRIVVAGIFLQFEMLRLVINVLIWEYPSLSLKSRCPYCDPCDPFKLIPFPNNIIRASWTELERTLQENPQINLVPQSVGVALLFSTNRFGLPNRTDETHKPS